MSVREDLGNRIRYARKEAGMSQEELARHLGYTQAAIYKIEKGKSEPGFETLRRIAAVLKRPLAFFLEEDEYYRTPLTNTEEQIAQEVREVKDILQDLYQRGEGRSDYKSTRKTRREPRGEEEEMAEIKEVDLPVGAGDAFTDDRIVKIHRIPESLSMGAHYRAKVRGHSMDPVIMDGDYIYVRRRDYLEHPGQLVVAHVKNIGTTVKFAFTRNDEIGLGKNLGSARWYPEDEVAICGIVVKIERPPNIIERLEQEALDN
ncbi:MAG: helix-turn-helix domain-containing protein [Chloroflexi bacterium]|nr:helix-turn-helix domain-containing protein [Chloroflexota bacterium]